MCVCVHAHIYVSSNSVCFTLCSKISDHNILIVIVEGLPNTLKIVVMFRKTDWLTRKSIVANIRGEIEV